MIERHAGGMVDIGFNDVLVRHQRQVFARVAGVRARSLFQPGEQLRREIGGARQAGKDGAGVPLRERDDERVDTRALGVGERHGGLLHHGGEPVGATHGGGVAIAGGALRLCAERRRQSRGVGQKRERGAVWLLRVVARRLDQRALHEQRERVVRFDRQSGGDRPQRAGRIAERAAARGELLPGLSVTRLKRDDLREQRRGGGEVTPSGGGIGGGDKGGDHRM